jgi:DNA-binding XRE family transcriptional regulator
MFCHDQHLPSFHYLQIFATLQAGKEDKKLSKRKTNHHRTDLLQYRRRMRFTQRAVADLLNQRSTSSVSQFESGTCLPTLLTALKLAAVYRAPVEFLFRETFLRLRSEIRNREAQTPKGRQGVLPLEVA